MPDAPRKLPSVSRRLIIAVLEVNATAVACIVVTMLVTEYLPAAIRIPAVVLLVLLVLVVWTSVLRRRKAARQTVAS